MLSKSRWMTNNKKTSQLFSVYVNHLSMKKTPKKIKELRTWSQKTQVVDQLKLPGVLYSYLEDDLIIKSSWHSKTLGLNPVSNVFLVPSVIPPNLHVFHHAGDLKHLYSKAALFTTEQNVPDKNLGSQAQHLTSLEGPRKVPDTFVQPAGRV